MFLIKQLYKQLPSPKQLHIALENRFHLITSFQLGDISKEHEIPEVAFEIFLVQTYGKGTPGAAEMGGGAVRKGLDQSLLQIGLMP